MQPRFSPLLLGSLFFVIVAPTGACDSDGTTVPEPVSIQGAGAAPASVKVTLDPFEIQILDAMGNEVLHTLTGGDDTAYGGPSATRDDGPDNVSVIPGWDGYVPDEKPWTHPGGGKLVTQGATSASFELDGDQGSITIDIAIDDVKVSITTTAHPTGDPAWNKSSIAFALRDDEHFFGLGERFASLDHRGISMYSWAEEGSLGGGEGKPRDTNNPYPNGPSMTYFPVPFFMSSAGYAVHLDTTYRTETHLGSERPDAWRAAVNDVKLTTVVYVHDDPLKSLDDFTRDTGRPMIPATWMFGPRRIVERGQMQDGMPEQLLLRQKKIPTTALDDNVHFLPARSQDGIEADLTKWVSDVHAQGFKVLAYNNPYVSTSIDRAKTDLDYGKSHGLFALTPEGGLGETFFISGQSQTVATIDLTTPQGVTWFQDLLRRTLAIGYDGWMHDFGEYVRRPWKFGDGRNGEAVHNQFPVLSAKATFELVQKEKPGQILYYVRSGYTGQQQYAPGIWSGDPEATFDETQGLPANLRAGLNLGMSGVSTWGSDISGFKCITDFPRDKEVYLRWAEVGAVSPMMMDETACSNPLGNRTKWHLWNDEETIDTYAAMARLHTRLAPYFELLAKESHATGIPIMRHPFLYYPHEPEAWAEDSTFFLGASLYAAPIVHRGETKKDAWLPPGNWVDLVDYAVYEGGKHVSIPAPLAKIPLLVKDGGIVPMLDASIDTLAEATDPTVITVAKVADRLDVVVALSPTKTASVVLGDGTKLSATRGTSSMGASDFTAVPVSQVQMCDGLAVTQGCYFTDNEGGVSRLRITSPLAASTKITHEDVVLTADGPSARRIRWDVLRIK